MPSTSISTATTGPSIELYAPFFPAITATRVGLFRSTKSTVRPKIGLPPRTFPREAPSMTSSASRRVRLVDDRPSRAALPDEAADDLDARVGLEQRLRLVQDRVRSVLPIGHLGVEHLVVRHLEHVQDHDPRPTLAGEARGRDERLLRLGRAEHRDEDRPELDLEARARSRAGARSGAAGSGRTRRR